MGEITVSDGVIHIKIDDQDGNITSWLMALDKHKRLMLGGIEKGTDEPTTYILGLEWAREEG